MDEKQRSCFVLMPFAEQFNEIYKEIYKPVCRENNVSCLRADEISRPGIITHDIVREILSADFILADLSSRNANVFYELGIAHQTGKNVILTCQQLSDVPFDVAGHRIILYEQNITGSKELKERLASAIRELLKFPASPEYEELPEEYDFFLDAKYVNWWEIQNGQRVDTEEEFLGLYFHVDRQVFSPSLRLTYSSYLISRFLRNLRGKKVLDLGTGCGALAIIAAKRHHADQVLATDIDPIAVNNAKRNVKGFRLSKKIDVVTSDMFECVSGRFDVIIANLPIAYYLESWKRLREDFPSMIPKLANGIAEHLADDGKAYFSWASFGDQLIVGEALEQAGLVSREFSEETFGVTWQVFEISRK